MAEKGAVAINTVAAFIILGAALGVLYDITSVTGKAVRLKALVFILDFLFSVISAFAFVLFLIAYCGGEIRWYNFFLIGVGNYIYFVTIHKVFHRFLTFLIQLWAKLLKKIAKKLKNSEKTLKKLLHLHK